MREDVALGMVVGRLLDALHRGDLRQHVDEQAGLVEQLEAAPRGAFGEDAHDLVADALPGDAEVIAGACARMAAKVAGSMAKSKRAAKRTARSMRRRSSAKRAAGSPMARMTPRGEIGPAADEVEHLAVSRRRGTCR